MSGGMNGEGPDFDTGHPYYTKEDFSDTFGFTPQPEPSAVHLESVRLRISKAEQEFRAADAQYHDADIRSSGMSEQVAEVRHNLRQRLLLLLDLAVYFGYDPRGERLKRYREILAEQ